MNNHSTPADDNEIEAIIACLGDDAATLRDSNPECEMAANMDKAARLLEPLARLREVMREQRAPSPDGKHITVMYPDGYSASGLGPLPTESPAEQLFPVMDEEEWHLMKNHLLLTLDHDDRHCAIAFRSFMPRIIDYVTALQDGVK